MTPQENYNKMSGRRKWKLLIGEETESRLSLFKHSHSRHTTLTIEWATGWLTNQLSIGNGRHLIIIISVNALFSAVLFVTTYVIRYRNSLGVCLTEFCTESQVCLILCIAKTANVTTPLIKRRPWSFA